MVIIFGCGKSSPTSPGPGPVTQDTATITPTFSMTPSVTPTYETWVPTSARTSTAPPTPSVTIVIMAGVYSMNSTTFQVDIGINGAPDSGSSTVTVTNLSKSRVFDLAYSGSGRYEVSYYPPADEYIPGDTYRVDAKVLGAVYTAQMVCPGGVTFHDYVPGSGLQVSWTHDGNNDQVNAYQQNPSPPPILLYPAMFTASDAITPGSCDSPVVIPENLFTARNSHLHEASIVL